MRHDIGSIALLCVLAVWAARGRWSFRRLKADLAAGKRDRLIRQYQRTIAGELVFATLALISSGSAAFRPPHGTDVVHWLVGLGPYLAAGVLIALGMSVAWLRGPNAPDDLGEMATLLPHTRTERWWFAGVSLAAGVCEELVFRGTGTQLAHIDAGLSGWWLLLALIGAFGLAHAYQGVPGVVGTGVLGGVLALLYLDTGSILAPIAVHALIDLRAVLIPQPRRDAPSDAGGAGP